MVNKASTLVVKPAPFDFCWKKVISDSGEEILLARYKETEFELRNASRNRALSMIV